jgi:gluconolactonase
MELQIETVRPEFRDIVSAASQCEAIPTGKVFGEGPVWNARDGYLLWTDAYLDEICRWAPGEGVSTFRARTGRTLALTYDQEGRLFGAGWSSRAILRFEDDGRIGVVASHFQGKRINTPNDLVVGSDGAIYWTDSTGALTNPFFPPRDVRKYLDFNAVFRLSLDTWEIAPVATDFDGPNGIAFSPDGRLLYVNDARRRHIRVFACHPGGTFTDEGIMYADEGVEPGVCDGMKVDVEGNVYCRASGGIHVISPGGQLLGRILLEGVTNLAWGESDWRTLFVTGRDQLFRIRMGVAGVPVGPPDWSSAAGNEDPDTGTAAGGR